MVDTGHPAFSRPSRLRANTLTESDARQKSPVPKTISGRPSPSMSPTLGDERTMSLTRYSQSDRPSPVMARTIPPLWSTGPPGVESLPMIISATPSPFTSARAADENTVSSA